MDLKKSRRDIKHIVIHCAATPEGREHDASDIDRWHRQKGWNGIGYNYVVKIDGTIQLGRDVDLVPAQARGFNKNAIGIVYIGGVDKRFFKAKDTRTIAQKASLIKLLQNLRKLYPRAKILGHRDLPRVRKDCPSYNAELEYKHI